MVSEAIFPTNRGCNCIEKWSQIFVSGVGSAHSESEEKTLFKVKFNFGKSFCSKTLSGIGGPGPTIPPGACQLVFKVAGSLRKFDKF